MKETTIRLILKRKFNAWLASIEDEDLRNKLPSSAFITGGAIPSMILENKVNDFDVYFRDKDTLKQILGYYLRKFLENPPTKFMEKYGGQDLNLSVFEEEDRVFIKVGSAGIAGEESSDYGYFEQESGDIDSIEFLELAITASKKTSTPYRPIYITSNSVTLSDSIQVVNRFYGNPEDIHTYYDFEHCKCWWDPLTAELHLPESSLRSIATKTLKYNTSHYPLCAMIRLRKFLAKGWTISAGDLLKIAWEINELDLSNLTVLQDQLIGVDTAYFNQVIELINTPSVEKSYLFNLIDKVF